MRLPAVLQATGLARSTVYRLMAEHTFPALVKLAKRAMGWRHDDVQQMKTKWGSCNPAAGTIRLNTELAKKPKECLEYIVLHEMVHLLEPTHGPRFLALMDRFMPTWRDTRGLLNRLPARHEQWNY